MWIYYENPIFNLEYVKAWSATPKHDVLRSSEFSFQLQPGSQEAGQLVANFYNHKDKWEESILQPPLWSKEDLTCAWR